MSTKIFRALALLLLVLSLSAHAELRLAKLGGDGMVLQRDVEVPLRGWAESGGKVTVTFDAAGLVAGALADEVATTVRVDATDVLEESFLGVGVQWSSYPWWDLSEEDWQKVFRRVEFLRMPFTRVMVYTFWYCEGFDENGDPIYTWDNQIINKLYKLLDWCEENGARVLLGEWGAPEGSRAMAIDDPRWPPMTGELIEHMLRRKKYTTIQYYNLINEPHGWWSNVPSFGHWKTAVTGLQKELERRGLADEIGIATADADRVWTTKVLKDDELRALSAVYEEHWYVYRTEIENGLLELYTREQVRQVRRHDPGKQFFLGEIGILDGKIEEVDQQPNVRKFWYGLNMADAAVQLLRGGSSGFLAWDLDDVMHFHGDGGGGPKTIPPELPKDAYERRKIWGFWNILGAENGDPEDEHMRPWFYPWAFLSRSFPPGSQTLETEASGEYRLRVASARIPAADGTYHFSFAVANNSDKSAEVRIVVPAAVGKTSLSRYDYFDTNGDDKVDAWPQVVDEEGNDVFPGVTETLRDVDLSQGFVVSLPAQGAVILTSLEGGTAVAVK